MKPNCMKCMHFYITYDKQTPKGCKAYGIQSQQLPSIEIKKANNGNDCIGFKAKPEKNINNKQKDLNNPKYW